MTGSYFEQLPKHVQRAIDDSFNKAVNPNSSTNIPPSHSKLGQASGNTAPTSLGNLDEGGGGFLVDDNEDDIGGGFVAEEADDPISTSNRLDDLIPFDLIPTALQLLDLPPDDEEILGVLRNAASGWSSSSLQTPKPLDPQTRFVSRDDWRSVCAVLLENRESDHEEDLAESSQQRGEDDDGDAFMDDEFDNSFSSGGDDDSDEEYQGERRRSTRTRRSKASEQHTNGLSSADRSEPPKKLTKRQYQTCLATYSLFFPDISNEELLKKRILVSDLQRVSNLLGEKTKAEEMVEMLEMFSTSKDKAMNFDDFTRMMVTARLA